jgi:hypothetical protein
MKVALYASLSLLVVSRVLGQQIASVDLTQPPRSNSTSQDQQKTALPDGCEKILPGIFADGVVVPKDQQPRAIVLEIVGVSADKAALGSELRADVRLRNSGKQSIQIPWSTDPSTVTDGQVAGHLQWEGGSFEVLLRGELDDNDVLLVTLTSPLFGSKFSPGSLLTMQPGESVIAKIKFKLESHSVRPVPLKEGKMELLVKWGQVARYQEVADCKMRNGYYQYHYEQKNMTMPIQVIAQDSSTNPLFSK